MEDVDEDGKPIEKPKIMDAFTFDWHINKRGFLKNIK
jgi:hypothetical protein